MAKTFEINRSSYYKWKNRNISKRVMNNKELLEKIKILEVDYSQGYEIGIPSKGIRGK